MEQSHMAALSRAKKIAVNALTTTSATAELTRYMLGKPATFLLASVLSSYRLFRSAIPVRMAILRKGSRVTDIVCRCFTRNGW